MPRVGSDLKSFLVEALSTKKYKNLFYLDELEITFRLCCPRKDSLEYISENIQIFKDWDRKKNHKFDYSYSRQRFESALKRSIYLIPISSGKDIYDFRFSSSEEIAIKKEKQRKRNTIVDQCMSNGEGHSSSPGSSCSVLSPYNSAVCTEIESSTVEETFDDYDDLKNFLMEETGGTDTSFEAPSFDQSLAAAVHDSILQDLSSIDVDNKTEKTASVVANDMAVPMECEAGDLQDGNGLKMGATSVQISEKHTDGCGIFQENVGLELQVLELVSSGCVGFHGTDCSSHNTSINMKTFLVNECYVVTLTKPHIIQ